MGGKQGQGAGRSRVCMCVCVCVCVRVCLRAVEGAIYLWLPSLGLPGFRCASIAALPAVLIFSCLPELETGFRALEELSLIHI